MRPRKWTDEQVVAELAAMGIAVERCRVKGDSLYGWIDERGQEMICMDDDEERADRIIKYLMKMGAPQFST